MLSELLDNILIKPDTPRDYIGASAIGHDCLRKIWYEANGYDKSNITPQLKRIFDTGNFYERYLLELLQECDIDIELPNSKNNYLYCKDDEMPFFAGHCDALIHNPKAILDIKTVNNSRFSVFERENIKTWSPVYYAQLQSYMGFKKINEAIILAINKDNCKVLDKSMFFDEIFFEQLRAKASMIYQSLEEPERVSNSPAWYQCKMCGYRSICHDI